MIFSYSNNKNWLSSLYLMFSAQDYNLSQVALVAFKTNHAAKSIGLAVTN